MPLEHVANEIVKKENPNADYHFCQCINISNKIAPYIKEKLTKLGVTKDFIFPDPQEIAKQSFEKTLAKFNLL